MYVHLSYNVSHGTGRFVFQTFFSDRFFDIFDTAKTGTLDIQEFTEGAALLAKGNAKVKLRFLFQVYDVDGKKSTTPKIVKQ